ncbi:hypothetical protein BU15DRAFT_70061 [Melanogaster broomeanus]|nr:hypothetical protein BU15DRAFT_70061 [Melanogaster broomeanus]
MDKQEKDRFIQDYVEHQKAYLSNYSTNGLLNDCTSPTGTPSRQLRSDEFGFATPVLRPRVSKVTNSQPTLQAKSNRKQQQETKPDDAPRARKRPPAALPSKAAASEPSTSGDDSDQENEAPVPHKKSKRPRPKQKKTPSLLDTDGERAARLADRRERKRKKRAIVNPHLDREDETAPPISPKAKKLKGKKASTPAALAFLHGFSATNVTKDRLTLKPTPSLGVFGRGKASVKTKTSTAKKSAMYKLFSESTFLNQANKRAAANPEDQSDDGSTSSTSRRSLPKKIRITNYDASSRKQGAGKIAGTPTVKSPEPVINEHAMSEVWDIELQSKCPSSQHEVPSGSEARGSASVVLDIQNAEWFAPRDVAEGATDHTRIPGLRPVVQGQVKGSATAQVSVLAGSELCASARALPLDTDASSLHPSHSASQVGRHLAEIQPSGPRLLASKSLTQPVPVSADRPTTLAYPQNPRASDSIYVSGCPPVDVPYRQIMDQRAMFTSMDAHTSHGITSPASSPLSPRKPILEFQTPYDPAPSDILSGLSDGLVYDGSYRPAQAPQLSGRANGHAYAWPPHGGSPFLASFEGDVQEFCHTYQEEDRNCYRPSYPSHPSPRPESGFSGYLPAERPEGTSEHDDYEEQALRDEVEPEDGPRCPATFELQHWDELDDSLLYDQGLSTTENERNLYPYEDQTVDADIHVLPVERDSSIYDDESADDVEPQLPAPDFLEGRALLLGLSEHDQQIQPRLRSSGLLQAEMDVVSRLRDHWRPQRL